MLHLYKNDSATNLASIPTNSVPTLLFVEKMVKSNMFEYTLIMSYLEKECDYGRSV